MTEGSSSSGEEERGKEGKNKVMVLSFNWHKYSVVIGFLKRRVKTAATSGSENPGWSDGLERSDKQDLFQLANEVKKELKLNIRRSAIKKEGKRELLLCIRQVLTPYTALTASKAYPFRVAINNTIITETAKYCSIHLSNEELSSVW